MQIWIMRVAWHEPIEYYRSFTIISINDDRDTEVLHLLTEGKKQINTAEFILPFAWSLFFTEVFSPSWDLYRELNQM
jgi:hypothetical protein